MRNEQPMSPLGQKLARLFLEHGDRLAGAVRGILGPGVETQELLQDVFLKALHAVETKRPPRNMLAWLFVITMNLAKDERRKLMRRGPRRSLEEVDAMDLRTKDATALSGLEKAEALAAARSAIQALGEREKEIFLLRSSAGLSFKEAAKALGIPEGTAKTRMRAALKKLRQSLARFAPDSYPRSSRDSVSVQQHPMQGPPIQGPPIQEPPNQEHGAAQGRRV